MRWPRRWPAALISPSPRRSPGRPATRVCRRACIGIGGFGGVEGLRDWLVAERVALVVDASHPFALRITGQAREAAARGRLPLPSAGAAGLAAGAGRPVAPCG